MNIQTLNFFHRGVFDRLVDRDMKALGTTCQKMYSIVELQLRGRDGKQGYLLLKYCKTRGYNNCHYIKNVDLFCLGRHHSKSEHRSMAIDFVAFMASRGPVVLLVESQPSMKSLTVNNYSKLVPYQAAIKPAFANNLYAFGWDDTTEFFQLEAAINQEYETKLEHLEKAMEYDQIQEAAEKLWDEREEKWYAAIRKTYPARIQSMVKTLQQMNRLLSDLGILKAKVVLTSGMTHLEVALKDLDKPEFDLTPFHEELKNHRVFVLMPKDLRAEYKIECHD